MISMIKDLRNKEDEINEIVNELSLAEYLKVKTNKLSKFAKRKLALAMTLIGKPDIILLDEPTS